MISEKTPLTEQTSTNYTFQAGIPRHIKLKRRFQCCWGAFILALVVCVLVIVVSYMVAGVNEDSEIAEAIQVGQDALNTRDNVEQHSATLQMASPSYRHQKSVATSSTADSLGRIGYASYHATRRLAHKRGYNQNNPMQPICGGRLLENAGWCNHRRVNCSTSSRYRTINGSCNNLEHANEWGVGYNKFRRMLPPMYGDGIGEPRASRGNGELPAASVISTVVHRPVYKSDPDFTVMLAVWGQFMDHDITATALSRGKNGSAIACCTAASPLLMHPECFPVLEKQIDGSIRCTDFVRSAPAATCCLQPREQINQVSSYIDGSAVYGGDEELAYGLRSFRDGGLEVLVTPDGRELLPISDDLTDGCNRETMSKAGKYCFLSGDSRSNENLHLTTMHLLLVRQHNHIARNLQLINPHWNDERLLSWVRPLSNNMVCEPRWMATTMDIIVVLMLPLQMFLLQQHSDSRTR